MINGPVLLEMARSAARERERDANGDRPHRWVVQKRSGVPARFARAWRGFWRLSTTATGSRRRHHVLLQHDEFEGW